HVHGLVDSRKVSVSRSLISSGRNLTRLAIIEIVANARAGFDFM
ncbi:MAG: hypothetical protein JWM11_1029, partial [Planctomycetaceae bacterium]|nr:hypothetical protein [Planctomycetaceae bacterium]